MIVQPSMAWVANRSPLSTGSPSTDAIGWLLKPGWACSLASTYQRTRSDCQRSSWSVNAARWSSRRRRRAIAVVLPIERISTEQTPILRNEQKEEPVNEDQELAVQVLGGDPIRVGAGWCDAPAELVVAGMAQKAIGEHGQALLDAIAQVLANPPPLLDRMRIVLLEQAVAGILDPARQPRAMEQPVERGEVLEPLLLEHARQVELDISLATNERAVAEESQASGRW